jgi:DNA helicase IV
VTDPGTEAGPTAQPPGAKRRALEEEQAHLDRVHDRVEELRARADERLAAAAADRTGSTFQARFERDVTAHHHAARAARYTFGDVESLAFGRLDLADGDRFHIGRVSVVDEEGDVVLVDWRAPVAAAFYRATAARPEGAVRRRTLVTRGREVRDLDDEVLDVEAAERLGLEAVTGQGALLAALSRERTGTMRDIVATIQADQDRIIRSPATGTLVVTGGPGTGKTVVALHRVAYLLYQDRDRFEGRGVLVVGPSRAFTEYTARVLPALGEDRTVQRPLSALGPPGVEAAGWDDIEVARIKGSPVMVEFCRRLLAAALPPIPPETRVGFDGTTAVLTDREVRRLRDRMLERVSSDEGSSYHRRADAADQALRAALWRSWSTAHRQAGGRGPEEREGSGFDAAVDDAPQVTMLRRCYWPELRADQVLARAATGEVDIERFTHDLLTAEEVGRLREAWSRATTWTTDDVALLDELAALLGPRSERATGRGKRDDDGGIRLASDEFVTDIPAVDVEAEDYRDFAHVVVDEAQDLSPMQWRSVARRGPYASWTVVGDLAQRSRVADPATWEEVAALIGRRNVEITGLSVNYRTPAEIAELARDVLEAAGHDPSVAPRAVRSTGERPVRLVTEDLQRGTLVRVQELLAARDGTLAVIAEGPRLAELRELATRGLGQERDRVRVLEPREAKGLEFDDVVIVAPEEIVAASSVGTHQLYVAVTRATRSLTLVMLPEAVAPGMRHAELRTED